MTVDGFSEAGAWQLLEQLRWGGPPSGCPHCGAVGRCYFLAPGAGGRRTRTGAVTARRVWKCGGCRRQFSVLTGSVLEGSRIGLPTWLDAIQEWVEHPGTLPVRLGPAALRRRVSAVLSAVDRVQASATAQDSTPSRAAEGPGSDDDRR